MSPAKFIRDGVVAVAPSVLLSVVIMTLPLFTARESVHLQWRIQKGVGASPPPIGSLFSRSFFFPYKSIYFVVWICDK